MQFLNHTLIYLYSFANFAPLALRIVLGVSFISHGYPKLKNRTEVIQWFDAQGIKPAAFWWLVVFVTEFFGGIALVLGAFVPVVAALLMINMLVAMGKVKWGKVGFSREEGWELDLAYFVMALSLVLLGAGAYSIDLWRIGL